MRGFITMLHHRLARVISAFVVTSMIGSFAALSVFTGSAGASVTVTQPATTSWAVHVPYGDGGPAGLAIKNKVAAPSSTVKPTTGPSHTQPSWTLTGLNANGIAVAKPTNFTNTAPSTATKPWVWLDIGTKNDATLETSGLTATGTYTFTVTAYYCKATQATYTTCTAHGTKTVTINGVGAVISSAASYERYTADEPGANTANFTVTAVGTGIASLTESGSVPAGVTGFTSGTCTSLTVNAYTVKCALRGTYAAGDSGHTPPLHGATAHAYPVTFSAKNATTTTLVTQNFTFNVLPPAICVVKHDTTGTLAPGYTPYPHTATAAEEPALVQTVVAGSKLFTGCATTDATGGLALTIDASPLSDIWSDAAPNTTPEDDYDTGSAGISSLSWAGATATTPPPAGPTATSTIAATFSSTDKNASCPPKAAVIDIGAVFCYVSDESSGSGPTYSTFFLEYSGHVPSPNTPTLHLTSSVHEGGTVSVSDTATACPASISANTFTGSYSCWWGNPTTTTTITATDITIGSGIHAVHPTNSTVTISRARYFFTAGTTDKKSHLTPEHISGSFTLPDNATLGAGVPVTITEPVNKSTFEHTRMGVGYLASTVTGSSALSVTSGVSITSTATTTFVQGSTGSFTVRTMGTPTPSLTEAGTLPTHVTFTTLGNGTARLHGTPRVGTTGTYPITITATSTAGTVSQHFTQHFVLHVSTSTITHISPSFGTPGTSVTISGSNFATVSAVEFGTTSATFTHAYTSTSITATAPPGKGTVNVRVVGSAGTTAIVPADEFTYSPTVTSFTPTAGPTGGHARVTITGTTFTGATAVKFGTTTALHFNVTNPTTITATTPSHSPGSVTISVTTPAGTATSSGSYTFDPTPALTKVTPGAGKLGGTTVTLTGSGFRTGATSVTFGAGNHGSSVHVTGTTTLTVKTPSHSAATVTVTVTTPGGTSGSQHYTFESTPTLSKVTPSAGKLVGGTVVTLTGTGFVTGATVTFGSGNHGTTVHVSGTTSLTVKAPAHGQPPSQ